MNFEEPVSKYSLDVSAVGRGVRAEALGVHTQLDHVSDRSHDHEADAHGLTNLQEFSLIRFRAAVEKVLAISKR